MPASLRVAAVQAEAGLVRGLMSVVGSQWLAWIGCGVAAVGLLAGAGALLGDGEDVADPTDSVVAASVAAPLPESTLSGLALSDAPSVAGLEGFWVPQLASGPFGADDAGYSAAHASLREAYGALLLTSDDFVFLYSSHWVSVAPVPFSTADEALGWCTQQGLANENCYAKLLTRDQSVAVTTAHNN